MQSQRLRAELILDLLRRGALSYMFPGITIPDYVGAFASEEHQKRFAESHSFSFGFHGRLFNDEDREESIPERSAEEELRLEELRQDEDDAARQARIKEILAAVDEIQEKYGVTIEEFEAILSYKVKLSHLRITASGKIYLDDFRGTEVKMDPLTKTVFLLFLNHSEGIEFKNISDHRKEIESIYGRVSRSGNPEAIRSSLDKLCNPVESNSLNEKVSRVKRAFTNVVDDRIARQYYIEGPAGGIRRIALDRDLVIWE